jgi:hypothetical protein
MPQRHVQFCLPKRSVKGVGTSVDVLHLQYLSVLIRNTANFAHILGTHGVKWRQEQLLLKRFLLLVQVLDRDAMGSIYAKFAAFLMKTVI